MLARMKVSDVLRAKGTEVITVRPDDTIGHLVELMRDHRIGAVVVSGDGAKVDGIVSERDVVHNLRPGLTEEPVTSIMTVEVHTCGPDDQIESLAHTMTQHRVRHVPVVVDGALAAIVSIGDVVKHRIDQLTDERDHLVGYLNS